MFKKNVFLQNIYYLSNLKLTKTSKNEKFQKL